MGVLCFAFTNVCTHALALVISIERMGAHSGRQMSRDKAQSNRLVSYAASRTEKTSENYLL